MDRSVEDLGPEPPAWWGRGQPMQLTMATVAEHVAVHEDIAMTAVAEHAAMEKVIASVAAEPAGDEPAIAGDGAGDAAGDGAGDDKPAEPCTKRRKTHVPPEVREWFCSLAHDGATAAPQRRAATRLLCNCQDTGILTPQWPPCACDLQSTTIACVSVFSASGTARARSFRTHERSRTTESTVFEHIHHKDRRQLQLFQRLALRRPGELFVTSVNTHPRGLPLRGLLSHHGTKTTWAMAFPRINCRTTTATVLTATATVT